MLSRSFRMEDPLGYGFFLSLDMLEAEKKLILQVISVGGVSGFFDWVS
jgi:hypothetical protein